MMHLNPLVLVGAVIGVITALLVAAYAAVKDKKTAMGFERNMEDGEIMRRLARYARPYLSKFLIVGLLMLFSIAYDIISPLIVGRIEELVAGRSVTLEAWGKGTDDYPRRHIRSHVTLDDINEAILYNPRNCYQNYNAATNSSERMLHTYMGTLLPKLRNVSYSTAGELSPLLNDPTCRTIGMGTRIFLCGARGYVSWQGTQFNTSKPVNEHGIPIGGARTVAAIGNLREMSTDYLRAAYYEKYGVSLFVGVGIPIPLLDEELAHDVSIRNEQITTNILDFGEEERPIGQTNYAELRSGSIEVRGQRVRTASVASLRKAREIAETLKGWIARGEFLLTEPVQPMPAHSTVKGLKADDE